MSLKQNVISGKEETERRASKINVWSARFVHGDHRWPTTWVTITRWRLGRAVCGVVMGKRSEEEGRLGQRGAHEGSSGHAGHAWAG